MYICQGIISLSLTDKLFLIQYERSNAASVEVGGRMIVVGGKSHDSMMGSFEILEPNCSQWTVREDLALTKPRYSFCAVPGL